MEESNNTLYGEVYELLAQLMMKSTKDRYCYKSYCLVVAMVTSDWGCGMSCRRIEGMSPLRSHYILSHTVQLDWDVGRFVHAHNALSFAVLFKPCAKASLEAINKFYVQKVSIHEGAINLGNLHYGFIAVPAASNYIHSITVCILKIFIAVSCAFNIIHSWFVYKWKPSA